MDRSLYNFAKKIMYWISILFFLIFGFSVFGQNFEVFVSGRSTSSVKKYDELGNYWGDFVSSGSGGLSTTEDILFHPDGTILVSGYGNNAIKRYDGNNGIYLGDFTSG